MPIQANCACGKEYRIADKFAGARVKCKECGKVILVPALSAKPHEKKIISPKENVVQKATVDTDMRHPSSVFMVLSILMVILQGGWLYWLNNIYLAGSAVKNEQEQSSSMFITKMLVTAVAPLLYLLAGLTLISLASIFLSSLLREYRKPRLCQALLIYWASWPLLIICLIGAGIPGMNLLMMKLKEALPALLIPGTSAVWVMQQSYVFFYAARRMGYQLQSPLRCAAEGYMGTFNYTGCMSRHSFLFFLWQHCILLTCLFAPLSWHIQNTRLGFGRLPSWVIVISLLLTAGFGFPLLSATIRRLRDLSIGWGWISPAGLILVPFIAEKSLMTRLLPISIIVTFAYIIVGALGKPAEAN